MNILITGASGSIGKEVVRQLLLDHDHQVWCVDSSESGLFDLQHGLNLSPHNCLPADIAATTWMTLLEKNHFDLVIHAAAYKHVTLSECHPLLYFQNNVRSTMNVIDFTKTNAKKLVMISTDKAVHPINVMGYTKRICELLIFNERILNGKIVRFGNVLNSSGSVIPIFKKQILDGGPVTVTGRHVWRYFMSIQQSVDLVLKASFLNDKSKVMVLDMGAEINVDTLARNLIAESNKIAVEVGKKTHQGEIELDYIGLRNGEKARESLFYRSHCSNGDFWTSDEVVEPSKCFIEYIYQCIDDYSCPDFNAIDWEKGCLK